MIVHLATKTRFREKPHGKGAQASCLFLPNEKAAGNEKATGKMPVLRYKIPSSGKPIDLIATIPSHCSVAVSASHESATIEDGGAGYFRRQPSIADRRYIAKDIHDHDPNSSRSNSSSASFGGLCAFAVKNSSLANFAWVQHMLHHLAPNGSMALLLSNGSMSSNSSGEGEIRRALIEADLVECMVALAGQFFTNTPISACIWFLTKNKAKRSRPGAAALRDRRGETFLIDATKLGFMKDRVLRDFTPEDTEKIIDAFRKWRTGVNVDILGFCKSATIQQISSNGDILTPSRYVGAEDTGTTFPEISKNSFRPISVVLPPKEIVAEFTAKVAHVYGQITANLHQSSTLAAVRDTLLPKLLIGEVSSQLQIL